MAPELTRFGSYTLLRRIASGGMAEIFLARQESMAGFAREVVIKRIHQHLGNDPEFITMFLDEAMLVARLSHPNIVSVYEFGTEGGSHFLAMEYVDGHPLSAAIRLSKGLEPMHALRIVSEMCAGLHYAHTLVDDAGECLGIVHRDISPQNVLLGFDGSVKLIDFGIAKAATQSHHTKAGSLKGKYSYMSPEQARGRSVDHRTDIHAAGIVLWEALTGRSLFHRESMFDTIEAVVSVRPRSVRQRRPELPEAIDAIIDRALAKSPEDRYQTAGEMQLAIDDFTASHGLHSSSLGLGRYVRALYRDSKPPGADAVASAPGGEVAGTGPAHDGRPVRSREVPDAGPPRAAGELLETRSLRGSVDRVQAPPVTPSGGTRLPPPSAPSVTPSGGTRLPPPSAPSVTPSGGTRLPPPSAPSMTPSGGTRLPARRSSEPGLQGPTLADEWDDIPETDRVPSPLDTEPGEGTGDRASDEPQSTPPPPRAGPTPPEPPAPAVRRTAVGGDAATSTSRIVVQPSRSVSGGTVALVVAGLVVVGVIGGIAWLVLNPVPPPSSTPVAVPEHDDGAVASRSLDGGTAPTGGTDADALRGDADTEVEDDRGMSADAASGPVGMLTAFLTVYSTPPGARVLIDGRHSGERTALRDLPMDPGEHVVELELEGYRPWRKTVVVELGAAAVVRAQLTQDEEAAPAEDDSSVDYGLLSVDTTPPSRVSMGRRVLGQTPLQDVELPAGEHTITMTIASGRRFTRVVRIQPARTTRLQIELVPAPGAHRSGAPDAGGGGVE
jgi:serine/threonine protein kinase